MNHSEFNNGQKTQYQQADDLLKQCVEESVLDSKLNHHFTADIEKRLQDLKDFNRSLCGNSTEINYKSTAPITEVLESLRINMMDDDNPVLSENDDEEIDSDIDVSNFESLSDNSDDEDDDKEKNRTNDDKINEIKKKKKWLSRLVSFRKS